MTDTPETLNQVEQIQANIHYAPQKNKEYLRQIQQQEYLINSHIDDNNNSLLE